MEAEQTETQETQAEEQPETQEAPAEEQGTRVELPKKPNRRIAAEQEMRATIERQGKEFREALEATNRQWREQFSALAQRPVVVQAPMQQQAQPQAPDPDALDREALAALDAKDMATYQRKTREAAAAHASRNFQQYAQQFQPAPQQNGVPVELLPHFAAHPEVAQHPRHVDYLEAKTRELIADGWQPGPRLAAEVFRQVSEKIKGGQKTGHQQYSQAAAAAITGTPGGRSQATSGGEGPGVMLTPEMKKWAAKAGMSPERYAEHLAKIRPDMVQGR